MGLVKPGKRRPILAEVRFVNLSGSAVALPWADASLSAILQAWYPGQAAGTAVADVLLGNYNPAGRLPVTFYRGTEEDGTCLLNVRLGAWTRRRSPKTVRDQTAEAIAAGAKPLIEKQNFPADDGGAYLMPQVLVNVDHSMRVMTEESFGPVIGIQRVAGDEEALALMNDTRYGLTAGVYTPDGDRAQQLLSRVHAGSLYWNCCDRVSPRLPWSGVGDSGVGLTLSTYGIQTFTRPKAWHLRKPA